MIHENQDPAVKHIKYTDFSCLGFLKFMRNPQLYEMTHNNYYKY